MTSTLAEMIGAKVKELRGERTLEAISATGKSLGFKWSSGSVAAIEKGESRVTLETLAGLCIALSEHGNAPLPVSDLIPEESTFRLTNEFTATGKEILGWLRGDPLHTPVISSTGSPTPATTRLASRIGKDPHEVASQAHSLWGKPFDEQRDWLAGEGASAQKKGQIARNLQKELEDSFTPGVDPVR